MSMAKIVLVVLNYLLFKLFQIFLSTWDQILKYGAILSKKQHEIADSVCKHGGGWLMLCFFYMGLQDQFTRSVHINVLCYVWVRTCHYVSPKNTEAQISFLLNKLTLRGKLLLWLFLKLWWLSFFFFLWCKAFKLQHKLYFTQATAFEVLDFRTDVWLVRRN